MYQSADKLDYCYYSLLQIIASKCLACKGLPWTEEEEYNVPMEVFHVHFTFL